MISKFKLNDSKNSETKKAISRTFQIANNYAGELSIEVLPLSNLELDPENNRELFLTLEDVVQGLDKYDPEYERKKSDWKSLESLANTIKNGQLINPIYVYRFGNKCRLIAGERRTLASAMAGKKEIIARISSERPSGKNLRILQWIENNERADLNLFERVTNLDSIINEYKKESSGKNKITANLLSELTGMSITQSRRYILIINSHPKIKEAIRSKKLENIKLAELICSVKDYDSQMDLLEQATSGKSFEEILNIKRNLDNFPRKKRKSIVKKKSNIKFGTVKLSVAKLIVDSLLMNESIGEKLSGKLLEISKKFSWEDADSSEKNFKKFFSYLDKEI